MILDIFWSFFGCLSLACLIFLIALRHCLPLAIHWSVWVRLWISKCFAPGFNFSNSSQGGRPPYDVVLVFKILVLQSLYNLSDDQTEYQIKDRLSFIRFLGLDLCQSVPDAKTIWLYQERLKKKGLMDQLFGLFDQTLREKGYLAMGGQIVDTSIIQAPRQRMTKEEKARVKVGEIPLAWKEYPAKLAQKDREAR